MTYEYYFDDSSAGIRSFPRHIYELLQKGLQQLAGLIASTNQEALKQGLDEPFERELSDVYRMIQWGEKKLRENGGSTFEVFVGQISIGSLRYLVAAALLVLHDLQVRRAAGAAKKLPKTAFRTLDRDLDLLRRTIDGMAAQPAPILGELAPEALAAPTIAAEESPSVAAAVPDPVAIRQILEDLESAAAKGRDGILNTHELVSVEQTAKEGVDRLLSRGSDSWRHGDKLRRRTTWHDESHDGYASPKNCEGILVPWMDFYSGLADLVGITTAKVDLAIRPGERVKALRQIQAIMARAKRVLRVVDPWVDETLLELVSDFPTSVDLEILTRRGNLKRSFSTFLHASLDDGRSVTLRHDDSHHDRFIVVDEAEAWHLGASIKDAGKRASRISRFNSALQESRALASIEEAWQAAGPIDLQGDP